MGLCLLSQQSTIRRGCTEPAVRCQSAPHTFGEIIVPGGAKHNSCLLVLLEHFLLPLSLLFPGDAVL